MRCSCLTSSPSAPVLRARAPKTAEVSTRKSRLTVTVCPPGSVADTSREWVPSGMVPVSKPNFRVSPEAAAGSSTVRGAAVQGGGHRHLVHERVGDRERDGGGVLRRSRPRRPEGLRPSWPGLCGRLCRSHCCVVVLPARSVAVRPSACFPSSATSVASPSATAASPESTRTEAPSRVKEAVPGSDRAKTTALLLALRRGKDAGRDGRSPWEPPGVDGEAPCAGPGAGRTGRRSRRPRPPCAGRRPGPAGTATSPDRSASSAAGTGAPSTVSVTVPRAGLVPGELAARWSPARQLSIESGRGRDGQPRTPPREFSDHEEHSGGRRQDDHAPTPARATAAAFGAARPPESAPLRYWCPWYRSCPPAFPALRL